MNTDKDESTRPARNEPQWLRDLRRDLSLDNTERLAGVILLVVITVVLLLAQP